MKLTTTAKPVEAERVETDDRPEIGSWWWVHSKSDRDESDYDRPGKLWLGCVIEVGSNYAKLRGVRLSKRLALDEFHDRCTAEPNPDAFIAEKLAYHKGTVRELMGEIQRVCHKLGVPFRQALAEAETTSSALAIAHDIGNVKRHRDALEKARDKTLPELFKKVKEQHEAMATWMKAELIPAEAELAQAREVTSVIEHKIHTVELYAGLQENLEQVREGKPAGQDARVYLMQRRHYMDEECLVRYEAGGMQFKDIHAFDAWIARAENFSRIFPHERCIVAFKVRRHERKYDGDSLSEFIKLWYDNQATKKTFLYIRNGEQLWRMETSIDFDEQLFPDREAHDLLGDHELWIKPGSGLNFRDIITTQQRDAMIDTFKKKRQFLAGQLWQWHRAGKPKGDWTYITKSEIDSDVEYSSWTIGSTHPMRGKPQHWHHSVDHPPHLEYQLLTPENIYHDDAMRLIARAAFEHNRIAVIVQGLLDRSTCLHPHPPWRIWTPEGFAAGIELVYDDSKALTPGDAPDFEAYRAQLNKSLKVGSHTIGQTWAWRDHMEATYGERKYWPLGYESKGPSKVHRVARIKRDGSIEYRWLRDRVKPKWVPNPDRPGYLKPTYPKIPTGWICPAKTVAEEIFCVDAYTPGDFHLFYDDPRTRAEYLKWAPYLLAAEDWHHYRREHPEQNDDEESDVESDE